jgi:hypothetical protein
MAILPLKTTGNRLQNTSCLDLMNRPPFLLANFFLSQIVLSKAYHFLKEPYIQRENNSKILGKKRDWRLKKIQKLFL